MPEEAELACLVLVDGAAKMLPLLLRSSEVRGTWWSWLGQAREDFLDCMAVLISSHRLRLEEMLGSAIFSCVAQVAAG